MDLDAVCASLRLASARLALSPAEKKNAALAGAAAALDAARADILSANKRDVERARAGGTSEAMIAASRFRIRPWTTSSLPFMSSSNRPIRSAR